MSRKTQSPEYRAAKTCRKKKTYETLIDASIKAAFYLLNNGTLSKPYECGVCGKYHLTTATDLTDADRDALHNFVNECKFTRNDRPIYSLGV